MKTVLQIFGFILLTFFAATLIGIIASMFIDEEKENKRVVNTPILNVRNGPGPNFSKIGEKQKGDKIKIEKDSAGWVQFVKEVSGEDTLFAWAKKEHTVLPESWEEIKREEREKEKSEKNLSKDKAEQKPNSQNTTNSSPEIGEVVNLKHDHAPSFLSTSESWDAMTEAVNANDKVGLKRLMRQGKVAWIKDDEKAKVLDLGMTSYKIRITEGPNSGTAGWVYRELITGK